MSNRGRKPVVKIVIGSEYVPEENTNYVEIQQGRNSNQSKKQYNTFNTKTRKPKTYKVQSKPQNQKSNFEKSKFDNPRFEKVNHNTLYKTDVQLDFKSPHGEPYVYIIDLVTNKISTPILATPYYKCYNKECENKPESISVLGSKAICLHCNKELEIIPHVFFNVDKYTYKRRMKPENTKDLGDDGIPLAWELYKKENTIGTTFNDCMRTYDKDPLMVACDKMIYSKYHEIAKVTPRDLLNRSNYKLLIYRNQAFPLLDHVGVGLESVNKNGKCLWKLTKSVDEEQYITAIVKIPNVEDYADFEHIEDFKTILKEQYLEAFGEF